MKLLPDSDVLAPWTFLHPNDAALFIYFYFFIFLLSYPAERCVFSSAGRRALGSVFCFMASCRFCSSGLSLSLTHLLFESEGAVVLMPEGFVWEFLL